MVGGGLIKKKNKKRKKDKKRRDEMKKRENQRMSVKETIQYKKEKGLYPNTDIFKTEFWGWREDQ